MKSAKSMLVLALCLLLAVSVFPRTAAAAPGDYFWDFNAMTNGAQPDGFTTAVLDTATYSPAISWWFPGNVGAAVSHLLGDPCVIMGSWFTNTSIQANRWLITPQVVVPEDGVLQWNALSMSSQLESYNVLISTGGSDPSEFTTLLSVTNERAGNEDRMYTTHAVDLSGYAGQPVYIAFQLVSLYKFCLFLDDIRIFAAHIVTASAGANGTVSPDGETAVAVGGTQTYTITPDEGYRIASVLVDGTEQGNVVSYTFSDVQENHTISATFERVFTLTASAGENGTISPDGETAVVVGGTETYTITPNAGYRIASVLVDGAEQGSVVSYTFTDVQADHTIAVSFAAIDRTSGPDYIARGLSDTASGVSLYGSAIHRSASLRVRPLSHEAMPAALRDALSGSNLLLGYDISVSRGFRGAVAVSFPVGMAYEGQTVTILHAVDGSIETYTAVVTGGMATVTVTSLSPFAVLSSGIAAPAYVVADPPKTGDAGNAAGLALALSALALAAALRKRKARL